MKLTVHRYGFGADSTLGRFAIDGEPVCFTLEDERREVKVPGETCIPAGEYRVTLRTVGGFNERYGRALPDIHKGMLWLRDVPGFEYILIHMGNTDDDTAGCIILGARPIIRIDDGEFEVRQSRVAYRHAYPQIAAALEAGEDVSIEVKEAA